jgi:hypothetical protein
MRSFINILLTTALTLSIGSSLCAQQRAETVKHISVAAGESYTDHIALATDSRDMDIMVKLRFDEANNQLTVSLLSYRSLFVFQADTRYRHLFKRNALSTSKLQYAVGDEETTKIKYGKRLRKKQLPKPRRKFVFKRWDSCEGMQAVPQDYLLANDFIERTYDILPSRSEVNFSLNDLLVMDAVAGSADVRKFRLTQFRRVGLTYHIEIERDPCIGRETEIELADHALETIRQNYNDLINIYGAGKAVPQEQYDQFQNMKRLMVERFTHVDTNYPCTNVRDKWISYNAYVDSIADTRCSVKEKQGAPVVGIDADLLYSKARQVDTSVTRWLETDDAVERRDLNIQCLKLIREVNEWVSRSGIATAEQQSAWKLFKAAEQYYKNTIKTSKKP